MDSLGSQHNSNCELQVQRGDTISKQTTAKAGGGGFRGGSAVKSLAFLQRLEFESQHPQQTAYNRQQLHILGIQRPLLATTGTCTHVHRPIAKHK